MFHAFFLRKVIPLPTNRDVMKDTYNYDEESVKALIEWAENAELPSRIRLTEAEDIIDVKCYVRANIYDIKEHYPDPFYNPSIKRLYRLKELVEGV